MFVDVAKASEVELNSREKKHLGDTIMALYFELECTICGRPEHVEEDQLNYVFGIQKDDSNFLIGTCSLCGTPHVCIDCFHDRACCDTSSFNNEE